MRNSSTEHVQEDLPLMINTALLSLTVTLILFYFQCFGTSCYNRSHSFSAVAVIGFINPPYSGLERDEFATLTVGVISGILQRDLVVLLTSEDLPGGATGMFNYFV